MKIRMELVFCVVVLTLLDLTTTIWGKRDAIKIELYKNVNEVVPRIPTIYRYGYIYI